jgi:hypothetical protein
MAKEEHILLENIFDTACVIEESFFGNAAHRAKQVIRGVKNTARNAGDSMRGGVNKAANFVADKTKTTMANRIEKGMRPVKDFVSDKAYDIKSKMSQLRDNLNDHVNANKTAYGAGGAGLVGLGAAAGAYGLSNKLGDATNDAGEAMHSLRDKISDLINAHHEA